MIRFLDEIDKIIDYILRNDRFIVTSHINPDGDNIGSSIAIYEFIAGLGKDVKYVLDDDYPTNLKFLLDEKIKNKSSDILDRGQTIIALDSGDYSRICIDNDILEKATEIICIDHHMTNGEYSNYKYIDTKASSTCELVYNLIKRYEERFEKMIISEKIATSLYTGLITDTGNFQYSNTEVSSFIMAADLMTRNADKNKVIQNIFQSNTLKFYKILGESLSKMEVIDEKISIIIVTNEMLLKNQVAYDDIDAITPYSRDIEGVELGIFIKEKSVGEIKVSLRSKNYVDCTKIAKAFGGGGHIRASGCTITDVSVDEAREMLIAESKKHI